jgi:CRP-like cAMP-binding protein
MLETLIRKLERFVPLSPEDKRMLERATAKVQQVGAREDFLCEGEVSNDLHLVLNGFACRYKILRDGQRQIMAYLLPGDFCDLHVTMLGGLDHSIGTLTSCTIVSIPRYVMVDLTRRYPAINRALWWATLVDEGTLREWVVNLGRRPADKRMAHLLCELLVRLEMIGLATEGRYELPLKQSELADTLGLSVVHVNRILQQLRRDGLITLKRKVLSIHDVERLKDFAEFSPNYLHVDQGESEGVDSQRAMMRRYEAPPLEDMRLY